MNRLTILLLCVPLFTVAQAREEVFPEDAYGYVFESCTHDYIDIADTPALSLEAAAPHAGNDEGAAGVMLDQPFGFYGRPRDTVTVSANGYLAVGDGTADDGADFRAACPLPAVPTNERGRAGRIYVLHGDLEGTGSMAGVHAQSFESCPRGDGPCTVIQWTDWGYHDAAGTLDFQVVLYPESGEAAFQYDTLAGDLQGLTVGTQDDRATRGATLQCGPAVTVAAGQSWCLRREVVDMIFADGFELPSR